MPAPKKTTKPAAASTAETATPVKVGRVAPAFTLTDQSGTEHTLADYRGKPVVLFFYPKDLTPGCTDEACQFRDLLPKFKRSKAAVFGISILKPRSKAKFAEKEGLNYPLLADDRLNENKKPDPETAQKYGVWIEKKMYGKPYMGIRRTTFLSDPNGKVAKRWDDVEIPGHAEEVLKAVKAL